jgi:DNA-binding phage protein
MIALGMLLVLIGFAFIAVRGGVAGSTAARNVTLGRSQLFKTLGYQDNPSVRYRIIQVLIGLAVLGVGVALIATST